jgi:hypothetical protein
VDHEVGPWKVASFHGPTSMVDFLENQFTKPLGPSLGVIECGPRGMKMHQNMNVLIFLIYVKKKQF